MWKYYVYVWYNVETEKPFYIGKGTGNRYRLLNGRSERFLRKLKSLGDLAKVKPIAYFKTSKDALEFECTLIKEIGLENLVNITPGGEGVDSETARNTALKRSAQGTMGCQVESTRLLSVQRGLKRAGKGGLKLQQPGEASRLSKAQVKAGTHPLLSGEVQRRTNLRLLREGKHLFQQPDFHKNANKKALENGTHGSIQRSFPFVIKNIDTNEVLKFKSISDCARILNVSSETAYKIYHFKTGSRTRHPYRRVTFND